MNNPDRNTITAALASAVAKALATRAVAEVLRQQIDQIKRHVLAERVYANRYSDERVTEPRWDWQLTDVDSAHYYPRLAAAVCRAGFTAPDGKCPALIAEWEQSIAENELIEAALPFFPELTNARLLCGTKDQDGLSTRRQYLDLLAGLVLAE